MEQESVLDWIESIEVAFARVREWVKEQEFNADEKEIAKIMFDMRFSSVPVSALRRIGEVRKRIGRERVEQIHERVKRFAIDSKFCTEAEWEDEE